MSVSKLPRSWSTTSLLHKINLSGEHIPKLRLLQALLLLIVVAVDISHVPLAAPIMELGGEACSGIWKVDGEVVHVLNVSFECIDVFIGGVVVWWLLVLFYFFIFSSSHEYFLVG